MEMETVLICRKASDPLKPGAVLGYTCLVCKKALAVSAHSIGSARAGAITLCNKHGFELAEKLKERAIVAVSPQALDSILEGMIKGQIP